MLWRVSGIVLIYVASCPHNLIAAHERLVTECNMLHKDIGTHTLFCYFRKNGDITGVLLDYDQYIEPYIDKTSIAATAPESLSSKSKGKQKAAVPVDTLA